MVASNEVLQCLQAEEIVNSMIQHAQGNWGNVPSRKREFNEKALIYGGQIVSQYESQCGVEFQVITEAHRLFTRVMLIDPENGS